MKEDFLFTLPEAAPSMVLVQVLQVVVSLTLAPRFEYPLRVSVQSTLLVPVLLNYSNQQPLLPLLLEPLD
jgi:hypothetical protein